MKQYIYTAQECGFEKWPQGELRLDGIEETRTPAEADIFTVPGALTALFKTPAALAKLPHFKGNEAKHVFFDCSDNEPLYGLPCRFIRCNTRTWYLAKDPNTISWPWPVEDFSECIALPEGGFKYDASFQGWDSGPVRHKSIESCLSSGLRCDIQTYSDFTGYIYYEPEGVRRRAEFRRSMKESRLALCPESIPGVFPYRFFEAMSAGRVPVLVSSNYVLPWKRQTPYGEFCIMLPAAEASNLGPYLRTALKTLDDAILIEMGRAARTYFDRFFNRDKWPQLMAEAVKLSMACA